MASTGKSSSNSGSSTQRRTQARRSLLPIALSGEFPACRAPQSGTGFETSPPLAISSSVFQFLKGLNLKLVGPGLESVPFQFGWDLVEWNLKLDENSVELGVKLDEFVKICDEVEEEQPEVVGLKLNLT